VADRPDMNAWLRRYWLRTRTPVHGEVCPSRPNEAANRWFIRELGKAEDRIKQR
jgi:hypothetical protein